MTSQTPVTPVIEQRAAQPYLGIRRTVTVGDSAAAWPTLSTG
ncbi:hypothetical protein [Micromonospora wenchangensis]